MQRLEPLQNRYFGSKIKIVKTCQKQLQNHIRIVLCRKLLQETLNIGKMTTFSKWPKLATMQRLQRLQNRHFGSKIKKMSKTYQKQLQTQIKVVLCKKSLQNTSNIGKMTTFLKWPKLATKQTLQPLQNRHFGLKIKIVKNMPKSTLEPHQSCSVQKTAPKHT